MNATVARKVTFNAAHRLHVESFSDQQNREIFGLCNNANYHGHNYELTVKLTGPVHPQTGFVFDLKRLKEIVQSEVTDRYDHRNLNLDCPEFATTNPTAENIAAAIYHRLLPHLPANLELGIILHETDRNYVEFNGNR